MPPRCFVASRAQPALPIGHVCPRSIVVALSLRHYVALSRRQDANRHRHAAALSSRCTALVCFVRASIAKYWPPWSLMETRAIMPLLPLRPSPWWQLASDPLQPGSFLQELCDSPPLPCDPQVSRLNLQPAPPPPPPLRLDHTTMEELPQWATSLPVASNRPPSHPRALALRPDTSPHHWPSQDFGQWHRSKTSEIC
jgi:hypothetical protein